MKLFFGVLNSLLLIILSAIFLYNPWLMIDGLASLMKMNDFALLLSIYGVGTLILFFALYSLRVYCHIPKNKSIVLEKDKDIALYIDEGNLKKILYKFITKFSEVSAAKISVESKKNYFYVNIILKIKAAPNVPEIASKLKEKTISFLKDLYAKDIIKKIDFHIEIDVKTLNKLENYKEDKALKEKNEIEKISENSSDIEVFQQKNEDISEFRG